MVAARAAPRFPAALVLLVCLAWLLSVAAQVSGSASLLHHDRLIEGGLPLWAAVVIFVAAWQMMIAAMMLPSSLPLIRLFAIASANQDRPRLVQAVFVAGYAAVWTAFGIGAFAGDVALHRTVDASAWLSAHASIIPAALLLLVGAFQFSALKEHCLKKCRLPANFLMQHYKRGLRAAFDIGVRHGVFCVGCCWALMLLGFAAGSANLMWMGMLTAIMIYEKTGKYGRELSYAFGAGFLLWGGALLLRTFT